MIRTMRVPSRSQVPGPTFVLIHGIGLSHRSFTGLARRLSEVGDVVSFDLPGFGSAPTPSRSLSVHDLAAIVGDRLRRSGIGPAVLVGHSMGAQIAIELARHDPAAATHVVLVGPVVDMEKPTLTAQALSLALDAPLEPPATQLMVLTNYIRCGVPWFLVEALAMRDYATHLAIDDVTQPVLVVRGARDPVANASWCAWLSTRAPDGRLATIPRHRHNVVHSNPAATATAILGFVAASPHAPATAGL